MDYLSSIPEFNDWKKITLVEKGWSSDKKYHIQTTDNRQLLLRVSEAKFFERKQREFSLVKEVSQSGITMSIPSGFGTFADGRYVYTLMNWVEGTDVEKALPELSREDQYRLGYVAGETLQLIHSLPAPESLGSWESRFNKKIDSKMEIYSCCPIKVPQDQLIIDFIERNRYLLKDRPQTFQHGDYHIGNLIFTDKGGIGVIDFNRLDFGDPWEEFNRIVWCAKISPNFASGRIDGYFNSRIPDDFFSLMALYVSANALASVPWAIAFGEKEVQTMLAQIEEIVEFYREYKSVVPTWYCGKV